MTTRTEKDSLGEIAVPADAYYGAQTARALANCPLDEEVLPIHDPRRLGLDPVASAHELLSRPAARARSRLLADELAGEALVRGVERKGTETQEPDGDQREREFTKLSIRKVENSCQ